jgi:hypothetical protein
MFHRKNLVAILFIFLIVACHKTYHIPENEILGAWHIGETGFVKHDGIDVTNDFSEYYVGFYYPKIFSFAKTNSIHSYDGQWTWMGSSLKQLSLDNGKAFVDVKELTKTSLHATFNLSKEYVQTLGIAATFEGDYEVFLEVSR